MYIAGYQKTTLLDYPGCVAASIFTGGCNFRCPFCHNSKLLTCQEPLEGIDEEEIFSFLKKRKNVLSGVCITGGEPTLQPDLAEFMEKVRSLGYKIKLDTNGYRPEVLDELLQRHLTDYIAMDIKAGLKKYPEVCGISDMDVEKIRKSIELIEKSGIAYEFRTTVVKQLHTEQDFYEISDMLSPKSIYYIQSFRDSGEVLTKGLSACDKETLIKYSQIAAERGGEVRLRGIE